MRYLTDLKEAREKVDGIAANAYARIKESPVLLFLIFLNLCITIPLCATLNVIIDEAYSLDTTGKDIGYALHQALNYELQPPLYFILLNLWRNLNHSIFFARLFSIICMTITIYCVSKLAQKLLNKIYPNWLVVAVFAFNPFTIWAALEIRLYAFLILLSALLWLAFYDGYFASTPKIRPRLLYIFLSIAALYTQYFSGFFLVANGAVLLFLRRWQDLRNYLANMAVVGFCFIPMLGVIPHQFSDHTSSIKQYSSLVDSLRGLFRRLGYYGLPISWLPPAFREHWLLYVIITSVLLMIVIKYRASISQTHVFIWVSTFVVFTLFVIVRMRLSQELIEPRHTAILFLPSIFSIAAVMSLIEEKHRRKITIAWAITLILLGTGSLYSSYKPLAKYGDYIRVAEYIMSEEKPNQPIVIFNAEAKIALRNYYAGKNPLVAIPKDEDFKSYDPQNFVFRDEKDLFSSLAVIPNDFTKIWVVNNYLCKFLDVDYGCDLFEESLQKYYSVETRREFYGAEVRLMRRK